MSWITRPKRVLKLISVKKTTMRYLILFLIQFIFIGSIAQPFTKGLIMRDSKMYSGKAVYIPESGLKSYDEFGEPIGSIVVKDLYKVFFEDGNELKKIKSSSLLKLVVRFRL